MKHLLSLKLNKEFKRAYYRGKYKAHPMLVSYLVYNQKGKVRVGITTGKKVGNAVCRSRSRRIIRAAFVQIRDEFDFPKGVDIVFVARDKTPSAKSTELAVVMRKQLHLLQQQLQQPNRAKGKKS